MMHAVSACIYRFLNRHHSLKIKAKIVCFLFNNPFRTDRPPALLKGRCNICGRRTIFWDFSGNPETFFCHHCGSSARNRAIAGLILKAYDPSSGSIRSMKWDEDNRGYIASGYGALARILKTKGFVISEYFENSPAGSIRDGVSCEDLTALSFPEEMFDMVVSENVIEHLSDPLRSLAEVNRVLKNGGAYLFTVPFESLDETVIRTLPDGMTVMPKKFHIDPLRPDGALVYTQFSKRDIIKRFLEPNGFKSQILTISDKEIGVYDCDVVSAIKNHTL